MGTYGNARTHTAAVAGSGSIRHRRTPTVNSAQSTAATTNSASPSHAEPPPRSSGQPTSASPTTISARPSAFDGHGRSPSQSHASTVANTGAAPVMITAPWAAGASVSPAYMISVYGAPAATDNT